MPTRQDKGMAWLPNKIDENTIHKQTIVPTAFEMP